jgi:hypothetical protein
MGCGLTGEKLLHYGESCRTINGSPGLAKLRDAKAPPGAFEMRADRDSRFRQGEWDEQVVTLSFRITGTLKTNSNT